MAIIARTRLTPQSPSRLRCQVPAEICSLQPSTMSNYCLRVEQGDGRWAAEMEFYFSPSKSLSLCSSRPRRSAPQQIGPPTESLPRLSPDTDGVYAGVCYSTNSQVKRDLAQHTHTHTHLQSRWRTIFYGKGRYRVGSRLSVSSV